MREGRKQREARAEEGGVADEQVEDRPYELMTLGTIL